MATIRDAIALLIVGAIFLAFSSCVLYIAYLILTVIVGAIVG